MVGTHKGHSGKIRTVKIKAGAKRAGLAVIAAVCINNVHA